MSELDVNQAEDAVFERVAQESKHDLQNQIKQELDVLPPEEQPKTTVKTPEAARAARKEVALLESGAIKLTTYDELGRFGLVMMKGGMSPKQHGTIEKWIAAFQYAASYGINPMYGMNYIAVVQGVLTMFGPLPLALLQKSGKLIYFNEYFIDKDYNKICVANKNLDSELFGAICEMQRAGETKIKEFFFTIKDVEKMGKLPDTNKSAVWNAHRRIMLKYKARAIGARDLFADILGGAKIAEHDFDELPNVRNVNEPEPITTSDINEAL